MVDATCATFGHNALPIANAEQLCFEPVPPSDVDAQQLVDFAIRGDLLSLPFVPLFRRNHAVSNRHAARHAEIIDIHACAVVLETRRSSKHLAFSSDRLRGFGITRNFENNHRQGIV